MNIPESERGDGVPGNPSSTVVSPPLPEVSKKARELHAGWEGRTAELAGVMLHMLIGGDFRGVPVGVALQSDEGLAEIIRLSSDCHAHPDDRAAANVIVRQPFIQKILVADAALCGLRSRA